MDMHCALFSFYFNCVTVFMFENDLEAYRSSARGALDEWNETTFYVFRECWWHKVICTRRLKTSKEKDNFRDPMDYGLVGTKLRSPNTKTESWHLKALCNHDVLTATVTTKHLNSFEDSIGILYSTLLLKLMSKELTVLYAIEMRGHPIFIVFKNLTNDRRLDIHPEIIGDMRRLSIIILFAFQLQDSVWRRSSSRRRGEKRTWKYSQTPVK